MSRIRIAQRAWEGASAVDRIGPQTVGVDLMWVEIDGVRITDVIAAKVAFADGKDTVPSVTVRPYGTVEIVYVGRDGQEIGSSEVDPRQLAGNVYRYDRQHRRPPATDLDRVVGERDEALARVAEREARLRIVLSPERFTS